MQVEPTSQRQQAFDVCVEVSGSISGLQLAIDSTIAGGRVVIGSWYSSSSETSNNNRAALRLGTRFYRSGIQLITSQVSSIPATIAASSLLLYVKALLKLIAKVERNV